MGGLAVQVRVDLREAEKMLNGLQRDQIPFATAYALTQCAKAAQREVEKEMTRVFDRPTPYTLRGVWTRPATKSRLWSEVKLKDETVKGNPAVRYLIHQIEGTARGMKGFEELLRRSGRLQSGWYAVPAQSAPLDAYGNVPRGFLNRVLSQLQASRDPLARETETSKLKKARRRNSRNERYFVADPRSPRSRHLQPGIYERVGFGFGDAIRPIFIYTSDPPRYRKRLKFYETVTKTVDAQLSLQFKRGFLLASRTAK